MEHKTTGLKSGPETRFAALAAALLLLAACNSAPPPNPTPIPDLPTPAAPNYIVQRGLVARGVEFSARVQPASSETLAFQTDGRLYKINVKEGDVVKQGDVLAELDLTSLKTQLEQEMIRLRTAQSVLSNTTQALSDTLRLAQLDVEQARLRYELSQIRAGGSNAVLNNDLTRIDKRIADIRESIRRAREEYNQAGAANAEKMLEDALIDRERLVATLSDAERGQRGLELESQILRADLERAEINLRRQRGSADLSLIEAVETARIAVEATQAKIASGSLIAPFDGEVGLISARVGEMISALSPLMVVARPGAAPSRPWARSPRCRSSATTPPRTTRAAHAPCASSCRTAPSSSRAPSRASPPSPPAKTMCCGFHPTACAPSAPAASSS